MATPTASTTLPLYWHLSSADKSERLEASVKLVHTLSQFQEDFVSEIGEDKINENLDIIDDDLDDFEKWSARLDASNAVDVAYAIRRLIRGLASPRESSRLGFAVALTELLSIIDSVTCEQVLALLKNASQTSGSMSGQEERDMLFARLFGLKSIAQSGLLTRTKPLRTSSNSSSSLKSFEAFLDELTALGEKKTWLKESCWWTLISVASALHDASVSWKKEAEDVLFTHIYTKDKAWGPEKIGVTLKLQRLYPKQDWQNFVGSYFKSTDVLANANLSVVGRILKDASSEELGDSETSKMTAGPWKPQLHFVWDIILDELLGQDQTSKTSGNFQDFYRAIVDEALFSSSSSPQRKYWGFEVFQKTLRRIDSSKLQLLFTKNFMRTWINHLAKPDRYLHKIARQVATDVLEVVEKDPKAGFTLVLQLTGTHGSHQFDRLTKTKTVETILGKMDSDGIKEYLRYLLDQVNEDSSDSFASMDSRRAWIIDQLSALLRKNLMPKSMECVQMALDWLTTHAFFVVSKKASKSTNCALHNVPDPAFSDGLHSACRVKLLAALADLIVQPLQQGKTDGDKEKQAGGEIWLLRVLDTVNELEKDAKHVKRIRELEDDEKELKNAALAVLDKQKAVETNAEAGRGVQILISCLLIKALCDGDEADWETLKDCIDATSNLFKPTSPKKKNKKKAEEIQNDDDRPPIDYIVDIIIGLLEQSTAFTRTTANMAFSLLTSLATESTVGLILTQLERRDPAEEIEDEGMDLDEEGVEENEDEGEDEDEDSVEDDSDEDVEDDDDDDEGDDEEANALRKALAVAMGADAAFEEEDESTDGSDEESMDDEQMMQIDEKLAAVFRNRVEEKKKGKNVGAQREATYFKNRVLDLVDTFMKKQLANPLVLQFILPLVEMLQTASSDEKQLTDKTIGILRSRLGKPKETAIPDDTASIVVLLRSLHQRARKAHSPEVIAVISICSLFVSKCIISKDEQAVSRIYKESISDFVTRKASSLNRAFFIDFVKRFPSQAWDIRASIPEVAPNAANGFRQAQLFSIIQSLFTAIPTPESKKDEILAFMPSVARSLVQAVSQNCAADKPLMTVTQMKEALKDGLQFCRYTKRFIGDGSSIALIWKPEDWNDLAQQLETSPHFKASTSLASTCRQISKTASSESKSNMKASKQQKLKRKVDGTNGVSVNDSKAKKKAKKARLDSQ